MAERTDCLHSAPPESAAVATTHSPGAVAFLPQVEARILRMLVKVGRPGITQNDQHFVVRPHTSSRLHGDPQSSLLSFPSLAIILANIQTPTSRSHYASVCSSMTSAHQGIELPSPVLLRRPLSRRTASVVPEVHFSGIASLAAITKPSAYSAQLLTVLEPKPASQFANSDNGRNDRVFAYNFACNCDCLGSGLRHMAGVVVRFCAVSLDQELSLRIINACGRTHDDLPIETICRKD
ncbi:hypothetical protein ACCO45_012679 [Purpureocillium lilacinum]|uniref:Uncharacterized protein n=1 Tax=Purpureocillium lilacinum TaxID=33203 RepID=A0ACC4DB82_PURLI